MMRSVRRFAASIALAGAAVVGISAVDASFVAAAPTASTIKAVVTPGAFCSGADAASGRIDYSKTGVKMKCTTTATDSRNRWREVVK